MLNQDWLVTADGKCQPRPSARDWDLVRDRYYLHQFLSDIIAQLEQAPHETEEWDYLPQIRRYVRQLILNSYWLRTQCPIPDSRTGVGIQILYDEIGYPLTVETTAFAPGVQSPIHNHGTWGIVAVLHGQEQQTFWRREGQGDRVEQIDSRCFNPGEIISFTPDAIHQVTALGGQPSITFNLYGDTQPRSRFRFDPATSTAKLF
ncbi:MAG: cupin [Spirulinaceae cyanobacterium RM2_2_10]|nr:cupin [Spirulinaceae cyanobacterium SM2_1_0]NJO18795.1 cupin [Spirulinaceae cyanobacterium RM2_2_10]